MWCLMNIWLCINDNRMWGAWRRAQYTYSTKLSRMDQMKLREMMTTSITVVFMALTKYVPLRGRWGAILMVSFHFFAAWYFSQNAISPCKQPARSREADVPALLHPQGPWRASNIWRNWYRICKAITGRERWSWIPSETREVIREHQEGVPRLASLCHCKWNPSDFPFRVVHDFTTGAMGSGEVWASGHGMDHCMRPIFWRSGKAGVYHNDELHTSHWHVVEDSKTRWHQAASDEDGWWYN